MAKTRATNEVYKIVYFIRHRVKFLESQSRFANGELISRDYRDEAGTLSRMLDEIAATYEFD